jgi:RNA polymerase sigma factor (sigma-70 family)
MRVLRSKSLRVLSVSCSFSVHQAELVFDELIDQLYEDRVGGFNVKSGLSAEEYDKELTNYLVYHILKRRAIDYIRSGRNKSEVSLESFSNQNEDSIEEVIGGLMRAELTDSTLQALESRQVIGQLKICVSGLSQTLRQVFELLLVDLNQSEIAARLDIPVGTVKSRTHKGLQHLKECLNLRIGL